MSGLLELARKVRVSPRLFAALTSSVGILSRTDPSDGPLIANARAKIGSSTQNAIRARSSSQMSTRSSVRNKKEVIFALVRFSFRIEKIKFCDMYLLNVR